MTDELKFDVAIIGAGALGLATSFALKDTALSVVIIEKESIVGAMTSSRNSEVIHSGIYYPKKSLKQRLCIEGQELLYDHLERYGINYKSCGKYIFSNDPTGDDNLAVLLENGKDNGVDLELVSRKRKEYLAEFCNISEAIYSPNTGIFNSHEFIQSLLVSAQDSEHVIALNTSVEAIDYSENTPTILCQTINEKFFVNARVIINAAGLGALKLLQSIDNAALCFSNYFVKGHYFSTSQHLPIEQLLYPMPSKLGLGVHMTKDLNGSVKFGPDTLPVTSHQNYDCQCDVTNFTSAVATNFKGIDLDRLSFSYSGIRPKIKQHGKISNDFIFYSTDEANLISALSYESPGLTSSLAAGKYIRKLMEKIIK